jgi:hypothetical protein
MFSYDADSFSALVFMKAFPELSGYDYVGLYCGTIVLLAINLFQNIIAYLSVSGLYTVTGSRSV